MRKLFVILLLSVCASATTTVTGTVQTLGTGNVASGAYVRFWLRGCAGNQPRINGTGIIAPTQGAVFYFDFPVNASGQVSGTLYSTRDSTGLLGGDIECGGSHTSVWYGMQVFTGGKGGPEVAVHAKSGATLDVSSVTPITTNPVIASPTGDGTYLRLDAGNSPVTGPVSFNNTVTATHGGTLGGTWAGNPTLSGNPTFTGTSLFSGPTTISGASIFSAVKNLNNIRFTSQFSSVQAAINDVISGGTPGTVYVDSPTTISSTLTVGQNSPSHIPVTLIFLRGAVATVTITNSTPVFELAEGSVVSGSQSPDSANSTSQIIYSSSAATGDTFRALSQDASQESMVVKDISVNANCSGGARVANGSAIFDFSELFNGTSLQNAQVIDYCAASGQAWGILVATQVAATDGAGRIRFDNTWLVPTGPNAGWVKVDGTANTAVLIGGLEFTAMRWEMNGSTTNPMVLITSGINGQIKAVRFHLGRWVAASPSNNLNVTLVNGCTDCTFRDFDFAQSGTPGTGLVLVDMPNNSNEQNYANSFDNIGSQATYIADWVVDTRTSITIPVSTNGLRLAHYGQDDLSTSSVWEQAGIGVFTGGLSFTNLLISTTVPTIAANGCGGSAAAISGTPNGTASFNVNVGSTPASTGCTVTLPSAATGWNCYVTDLTTNSTSVFLQKQTGGSQTTAVLQNFNDTATATAPTGSDIYHVSCFAN